MTNFKTLNPIIKAFAFAVLLAVSAQSNAWTKIELWGTDLLPGYPQPQGFGDNGFYMGYEYKDRNGNWRRSQKYQGMEFDWDPVYLMFDESTGNASINASMKKTGTNEYWGFNMELTDIELSWKKNGNYDGTDTWNSFDVAWVDQLFKGEKFGAVPDWGVSEWGFGWEDAALTITRPDDSTIELSNYNMQHKFTTELHWDVSQELVTFEGWWKNDSSFRDPNGYWYREWGDTKAHAKKPPTETPVPATAAIFGLGLLMLRASRKRKLVS